MSRGLRLAGIIERPAGSGTAPWIVASHGLFASKESEKWTMMSRSLCRAGFSVLRFDFAGCGESQGSAEDTTITDRLKELEGAVSLVVRRPDFGGALGLVGSSLGGMLSVIYAASHGSVDALAILSTPDRIGEPTDEMKNEIRSTGYCDFGGSRLSGRFWEDTSGYVIAELITQVTSPVLIIHGSRDEHVPADNAVRIFDAANRPKAMEIIEGGDHGFSDPSHRERVVNLCTAWFKRHLAPAG